MTTATDLPRYQHVIDGRRVEAASGQRYASVARSRGAPWASAADGDAADVDLAVAAARRALGGPWGQLTGFGRAALMRRLGDLIARDADRLAVIETRDTGKLLREMRGQLGTIPQWFSYFSGLADKLEGTTIPGDKPTFLVYTRREPAGVVAAIVPWNSPLLLLCWKLAPALAAGCTMVAKPSDYSPASAVELAALMDEAGFPPGVFNVVTGFGPAVGKALAAHPDADKIAFTGSTAVGGRGAAVRQGAGVPGGRGRGGAGRDGGGPARRRIGRVLRPAHRAHRGQADDDGGVRGGVRPGSLGDPVRHRGRSHRAGQRQPVRAGRGGVDQGHPPRPPGGARDAHRHRVDQRVPGGRARRAVRRGRAERARPGEPPPGRARVHAGQSPPGRADPRAPRARA